MVQASNSASLLRNSGTYQSNRELMSSSSLFAPSLSSYMTTYSEPSWLPARLRLSGSQLAAAAPRMPRRHLGGQLSAVPCVTLVSFLPAVVRCTKSECGKSRLHVCDLCSQSCHLPAHQLQEHPRTLKACSVQPNRSPPLRLPPSVSRLRAAAAQRMLALARRPLPSPVIGHHRQQSKRTLSLVPACTFTV